jgi:arylsulfatase A-like enzyme
VKAGSVNRSLACNLDLFNTGLALAGAEPPTDRPIDGTNLLPALTGAGPSTRDVYFYYRDAQLFAVRKGPFKAHYFTRNGYGQPSAEKHDPPLLFHLGHDPSEQRDIAAQHPDVLRDLAAEVERHRAGVTPGKNQLDGVD